MLSDVRRDVLPMRAWPLALLSVWLSVASGCTHLSARDNTLSMGSTLTELQYRIVLDNIAALLEHPDALPWHVNISDGTVQVTDSARITLDYVFNPINDDSSLGVRGKHSVTGQWDLSPVTDPQKLQALTLAYGKAMGNTVDADAKHDLDDKARHALEQVPAGWYGWGGQEDVPDRAAYVGHHHRRYVWVVPDKVHELSLFTLVVLMLARGDAGLEHKGLIMVPQ